MSWEKARGARSPQLLVILLLALAMTQCVNCAAGHGTGIFLSSAAPCKIDAKRGYKAGICRTRVAGQPHEGSGLTARPHLGLPNRK